MDKQKAESAIENHSRARRYVLTWCLTSLNIHDGKIPSVRMKGGKEKRTKREEQKQSVEEYAGICMHYPLEKLARDENYAHKSE